MTRAAPAFALALALAALAPTTAIAAQTELTVYLHEDPLHVLPELIAADVGDTLTLTVENPETDGKTVHNLLVCGDRKDFDEACADRWAFTPMIQPGTSATITFEAKQAGTFEYYCYIAGHKSGGMVGELQVKGTAEEKRGLPFLGLPILALALAIAIALVRRRNA